MEIKPREIKNKIESFYECVVRVGAVAEAQAVRLVQKVPARMGMVVQHRSQLEFSVFPTNLHLEFCTLNFILQMF